MTKSKVNRLIPPVLRHSRRKGSAEPSSHSWEMRLFLPLRIFTYLFSWFSLSFSLSALFWTANLTATPLQSAVTISIFWQNELPGIRPLIMWQTAKFGSVKCTMFSSSRPATVTENWSSGGQSEESNLVRGDVNFWSRVRRLYGNPIGQRALMNTMTRGPL